MEDDINRETAVALAVLVACGIGIFAMAMFISRAHGSPVCLTKSEARQLWPRSHLYWYSKDHCWSNRRGPPHGLKFDPVFSKAHAEAPKPAAPPVKIVRADEFNEIDAQADQDTFFNAKPFTYQQYVLNLDRYRDTSWHRQIWGLAKEGK